MKRPPCSELTKMFYSFRCEDINAARNLCLSCEYATHCLDRAITRHEPAGVWGGFLIERGHIVVFKRNHGHPREGEESTNELSYDIRDVPERYVHVARVSINSK